MSIWPIQKVDPYAYVFCNSFRSLPYPYNAAFSSSILIIDQHHKHTVDVCNTSASHVHSKDVNSTASAK